MDEQGAFRFARRYSLMLGKSGTYEREGQVVGVLPN